MKICPKCQKTYDDDRLNFCLEDGTALNEAARPAQADDSLPETVLITPRDTSPDKPGLQGWGREQKSGQEWEPPHPTPPAWGTGGVQQGPPGKPKSRAWIWVLGILAAIVFVCGGGILGLIAIVSSVDTTENTNSAENIAATANSPKTTAEETFVNVDISKLPEINPADAEAEYKDGELLLATKKRGFYYVVTANVIYRTEDCVTRLTVRNADAKSSRLGYGLIFHSNPTQPLAQDYGFLIDADKKRYRVVMHSPGAEKDVVKWKSSLAVKGGSLKNVLEVHDKDGKFDLYINGQLVESLKNTGGYPSGVAGVYTSDAVTTAFSNLEVSR